MEVVIERMSLTDDVDATESKRVSAQPRSGRRLNDKLMLCFHQACEGEDFETAQRMLQVIEMSVTRRRQTVSIERRKHVENLVAAHERLWLLRNNKQNAY